MVPTVTAPLRALLVAAAIVASLAACGRRGALEPPPNPRVPAAQAQGTAAAAANAEAVAEDDDEGSLLPAPTPSASPRERRRGFTIPKEPFILDPLL